MSEASDATVDRRRSMVRWGAHAGPAVIAVLLGALALALLVAAARSRGGPVHRFDLRIDDRLNAYAYRHSGQISFWKVVTEVGGPATWRILAGIAAVGLWLRRLRRAAVLVVVAMAGAAVLSGLIKVVVDRARPIVPHPVAHAGGGSFPSGHALTSATAMALLVLLVGPHLARRGRVLLTLVAAAVVLAVGFSRLILGVHYVTDVVGGWVIAALWVTAARFAVGPRAGSSEHPLPYTP